MLDHIAYSTKAMQILIFGSHSNLGYTGPLLITVGVLILSASKTQINGSRKCWIQIFGRVLAGNSLLSP
jgi:hypothetical protein